MSDVNQGVTQEQVVLRIKEIQARLKERSCDFLLLTDRENLLYFTDVTQFECMGMIIPQEGVPTVITLWLDVSYLQAELPFCKVLGYRFPEENLGLFIFKALQHYGIDRPVIGFAKYFVEFNVFDALRQNLPSASLVNATDIIYRLRSIKSSGEIERIKTAGQIAVTGMAAAIAAVAPGIAERRVAADAEYAMLKAGSEGCPFRLQVVSGERVTISHGYATEKTIEKGDLVTIHLGARFKNYTAKMCRTVKVGAVSQEQEEAYDAILAAQQSVIAAAKPGVSAGDLWAVGSQEVEARGFGKFFIPIIAHGVGIRATEFYPIVGRDRDDLLEENMVFGPLISSIYKPRVGGARVTDTVLITDSGPEILTPFPYTLFEA